jgi:site-specific DNA recombinase
MTSETVSNVVYATYGRFSGHDQNPKSAEDQSAELRADAGRKHPDWVDSGVDVRDSAISGRTERREGLQRLDRLIMSGRAPFNVVLVESVNRTFRNRVHAVNYRARWKAKGVKILSMADGYLDPDTVGGLYVTGINEVKAEADLLELAFFTRRGQGSQNQRGYSSGRRSVLGLRAELVCSSTEKGRYGQPKLIGVKFVIDPEAAKVVLLVFHLFAWHGWGLKRIARYLNTAGVVKKCISARDTKLFYPRFVAEMLRNEIYVGRLIYNRTRWVYNPETETRRSKDNPREEWKIYEGPMLPAIVDLKTWDRAQEIIKSRAQIGKGFLRESSSGIARNQKYLLSGIVYCASCGRRMVVSGSGVSLKKKAEALERGWNVRRRLYYKCANRLDLGSTACSNESKVSLEDLEEATLKTIDEQVLDEEGLGFLQQERARIIDEIVRKGRSNAEPLRLQLAKLKSEERIITQRILEGCKWADLDRVAGENAEHRRQLEQKLQEAEKLEGVRLQEVDRVKLKKRIWQSRQALTTGDVGRLRIELENHIERIDVTMDGNISMKTYRYGLFGDRSLLMMVAGAGFEPATSGL